ncbi:hypothetical protein L3X38_004183 [Prunus dulcis]|uniref:DUF659 domain-containing protein n=1 Tax=Prunus dulcis TaxID=3755 RepID=A0AAD4ZNE3_PRUDU|nr:hypothetical protein L3X38_004183 [Prunus dulcis]
MVLGCQQASVGVQPPTPYEVRNKYLEIEYKDISEYVNKLRSKWETNGCTIMCDGWTGPTRLSIINFVVYSKGKTIFLKSVDASDHIKNYKYIYKLLRDVIMEVGEHNVVQVVTDKGGIGKKNGARWVIKIIDDRWYKTLYHDLHAAAYYLNPRYQYRPGVGDDGTLIHAVHKVYSKLDPASPAVGQFGNELTWFKDARRTFG